ncbi:MAG: hypothetical protein KTR20_07720 [Cellvibrionaceae bacterium]|nr:hypothetical protein [Cellvibrionaceae bacterium]
MKKLLGFVFVVLLTVGPVGAALADKAVTAALKRQQSAAGIGLTGLADWSTEMPFLDFMKVSRPWYDWQRQSAEGIELDQNGWVTAIAPGVYPQTVFLTNVKNAPIVYSHYIVRWQGKGTVKYGGCAKKVGRAYGGDRISVTHGSCFLGIAAMDKDHPVRNITVVPEKHIAAFDRGDIFNPDFIAVIRHFRALRFMNWLKTNGSEQSQWADRPRVDDRSYAQKGVPIELIIALANRMQADPWLNIPHKADADYIEQFARVVRSRLHADLKVYIEHSNEVWNWIFPQAHYALARGKQTLGDNPDVFMQWHGMRTAQMCDLWKREVFREQQARVVCVLGAQAAWPGLEIAALECPLWAAKGHGPCYTHGLDAVAIAGYFSGCLDGGKEKANQQQIIDWRGKAAQGLTKAYEQALDGRHFFCEDAVDDLAELYQYHVKKAAQRQLKVVAYEGGQHITSNLSDTQNDQRFYSLHIDLNRSALMAGLYQKNFANWKASGATLFMHFVGVSAAGRHGSWGALEYLTQPTSPKWEALMTFNQTPCWWEHCAQ